MERIFALYDSDALYATKFMEYFNRRNETDFEIAVFTRRESLEDFLKLHQIEILLLENPSELDEQIMRKIKYIYPLSENPPVEAGSSIPMLSKYQSVRVLMDRIITDYLEKEKKTRGNQSSGQTSIISVFSPVPGQEKLAFAWSLSLQMSEKAKVLFILLDLFPVPLLSQIDNSNQSLSEFIYYLKESSDISKMKSLLKQNGRLSCLSGILHGADILSLSREDIQKWVEELRTNSEYNTIVFYQSCYSEAMIELMKLSDTVLVTSLDAPYEKAVFTEWDKQMSRLDTELGQDKYHFIYLQKQEDMIQVPLAMTELVASVSWQDAKQYLNS